MIPKPSGLRLKKTLMTPKDQITALRRAASGDWGPSSDFDLNTGLPLPSDTRPGGVLIAFDVTGPSARLILTRRSMALRHHPGQIAFPGGGVDPGDDGPVGAALREASEEIGLPPACVEVLGTLPPHVTVTAFHVTPVLALVTRPFDAVPEAGEVDEVFTVPFDIVSDPAQYRVEGRQWQGTRRLYYTVPYGPYYIWGATARMLYGLAQRLSA